MVAGQTSAMSCLGGSGRRQRRAMTLASEAVARLGVLGQLLGQAGFLEEELSRQLCAAHARDHLARHVGGERVDGNGLADAVDCTGRLCRDRARVGGDIGGDQEDLVLVDTASSRPGANTARTDGPPVSIGKVFVPPQMRAAQGGDVVAQGDHAGDAAGQRALIVDDEGLLVHPAAGLRHRAVACRGRAWRADRRAAPSVRKSEG